MGMIDGNYDNHYDSFNNDDECNNDDDDDSTTAADDIRVGNDG